MKRKQRLKLLTFVLIGILMTGSFGAAASAAETDAPVSGESVVASEQSGNDMSSGEKEQEQVSCTDNGTEETQDENAETAGESQKQETPDDPAGESGPGAVPGDPQGENAQGDAGEGATGETLQGETAENAAKENPQAEAQADAEGEISQEAGTENPEGEPVPEEGALTEGQETVLTEDPESAGQETALTADAGTVAAAGEQPPVKEVLGTPQNVDWSNTTVLSWDAVENTNLYKITVWLKKDSAKYSKTVDVTGRTSYDLEEEIVSLIKTNRKALTGAAYIVWATVQARTPDAVLFANSKAGKSPSFRYLRTTYLEALDRNGWFLRNGAWYYYEDGVMQKGWISFNGNRYYLNKDGAMVNNCWMGGKYLKSDGSMAKNEWVDNYSCYVGQDGKVIGDIVFSTTNWIQTSAGWRYKDANGKYIKNTWYPINHRMYYFDAAGHLATGWLTIDGKSYYLNNAGTIETGKGARQSGWKKIGSNYYWFDKNGVMAKSQWVDRGQYYVNAAGRRQSWLCYANLRNVNTSNRLGYDIYSSTSPPEQSIASYDLAYKNGNRILVIDLRFTKDNVPVCFHDDAVKYARWKNGNTPGEKPSVSKLTYEELCQYDFGIYRGAMYKGTAPLTLEEMAKWIKKHTDAEVYIEVKADQMNMTQIRNTTKVLSAYNITGRSSVIFAVEGATDLRVQRMHKQSPSLRIGITSSFVGNAAYELATKTKGTGNEVFFWCWNNTPLTDGIVNKLKQLNVQFECGTFANLKTFDDIIGYYLKGSAYAYNSGVETPGGVFSTMLKTATFHDKAQWVNTAKGWMYRKVDQTFVKNKWLVLGAKKYHFSSGGIMQTGWLNLGGTLYYLDSDGSMVTGWKVIASARYYFNADGVMLKGQQVLNGHTYLFDNTGKFIRKIS